MGDNYITIYTTFPNTEIAQTICNKLVKNKLIACANILPGMVSIYEWNGKISTDNEVATLLKTTSQNYSKTAIMIKEEHPYNCPCIVQWDINQGNPEYLNWITQETNS